MTKDQAQKVIEYINANIEFAVNDYIDIDEMQILNCADDIYQKLEDDDVFSQNSEVIYYSNAIEYLKENDSSLLESLELANNMGFTLDKINSEILASILMAEKLRQQFRELEKEIDNILSN